MNRTTELLECRDRLDVAIRRAKVTLASDTDVQVPLAELIALARKVTPSTRAPPGILFSAEQGPLEALPIRFRLPYPTLDEMKMSLVATEFNKLTHSTESLPQAEEAPVPPPISQPTKMIIEDVESDDYEDDF